MIPTPQSTPSRNSRLVRLAALTALAGIALAAPALAQPAGAAPAPAAQPAGGKTPVKTAADLPVHMYTIEGKPSDLILAEKGFSEFAAKVKADLEADLAKFDIQDRTTLQQMYAVLQGVALIDGKLDDAAAYVEKIRALEQKESKKLMTGQVLAAYIAAVKSGNSDKAAMDKVFKETLKKNVSALPWEVVREEVTGAKGRAEMLTKELIVGQIKAGVDPVAEQGKGQISSDFARGLIQVRAMTQVLLPLQPAVGEVFGGIIAANTKEMKDNWTANLVKLKESDKATPVVICIWDSGVDTSLFSGLLYVNAKEQANGKDDDGNGFVDDVNGIAFDLESNRTPELLHATKELKSPLALVEENTKGMSDVKANIESPEAAAFKKYVTSLKSDQVESFLEDLGLYGNYSHGTHVAGIAAAGNPFARLLPCRLTFDYRAIPLLTPTEELSRKTARSYMDAVAYMKTAGVRVVNMSWGGSYKDIEDTLEKKGVGNTPDERAATAKRLFDIEKEGLEAAIKSAPEILFVVASGNGDNDNAFVQFIPSGLNLPNMVTIGAVDRSGKPTSFTTFGKNVKLYANGYEVESYVPGGKRMKYSGTSMASPNAANLAAKLIALNPKLSPQQTIDTMFRGAEPMEGHSDLLVINPKKSIGLLGQN